MSGGWLRDPHVRPDGTVPRVYWVGRVPHVWWGGTRMSDGGVGRVPHVRRDIMACCYLIPHVIPTGPTDQVSQKSMCVLLLIVGPAI